MERNTTDTARVKVVAITRVIPSRLFETAEVEPLLDESVASLCSRAFPKFPATHYALDGRNCEPGTEARNGRVVVCWNVPGSGIEWGALLVYALVSAVVSTALSYAVNALTAKKAKKQKYNKQTEELSDEQYGWDYDARNAVQEGAPVPVLYGRRMVLPPIIQQRTYTDNASGKGFAELVYAVADAGGGFDDKISFPLGNSGYIQALLDHTPWQNYNGTDMGRNYMANQSVYNQADYNGSTITGTLVRTSREQTPLTNGRITDSVTRNFNNIVWQTTNGIKPTRAVVYSKANDTSYGVDSFTLYGYNNGWQKIMDSTSSRVPANPDRHIFMCEASRNEATGPFYTVFKIANITWYSDTVYSESYQERNISEIEIYTYDSGSLGSGLCAVNVNMGLLGQQPSDLTDNIYASLSVQKRLDLKPFSFLSTPKATPDRLAVHIEFPQGIYSINSETGDYEEKPVKLFARFRPLNLDGTPSFTPGDPDEGWQFFFNASHASGTGISYDSYDHYLQVSIVSQQPLKLSFERTGLTTPSHFEVEMYFFEDPLPVGNDECTTVWNNLDEGWGFDCAYTRTATATMKLLASETLYGEVPQFKILAEREYVNVFNSIDGEWQPQRADNPAWAAYDILCNPKFDDSDEAMDGDEGDGTDVNDPSVFLREQFPHRKLIYSEFAAWADFCDEFGITCSIYFDSSSTVEKALGYLCDIGRAQLVNRGGTIGVAIDCAVDAPVYAFNPVNIVKDSWSVTYMDRSKSPTEIEVTFFDREREWQRFTVTARDPDKDVEGVSQNTESVTLYACDRRDVAQAYAQYLLERSMVKRTFRWTGDLDSMPCDIGDVVTVKSVPARIISATYDEEHRRVFEAEEYVAARYTTAAYPTA